MRWFQNDLLEPGLMKIFRIFTLAVTLFFFLFYSFPAPVYAVLGTYRRMLAFMGLSYGLLFIYLTIKPLRTWLKGLYLPLAVLASIFIPMGFINWAPSAPQAQAMQPINSWTVTILMLFPLVITAWQYSFKIVLIFFAVLGILDPIISALVYQESGEGIHMIIYVSAVRIVTFTAIGYIITELMKNQKKKQYDLEQANRKLKEYARQTRELAITRERNRLASELHDVLAHTLSGLTVHLEAIDAVIPPDQRSLREEIRRAIKSSRGGLKETRRALHDLRAQPIETYGILHAMDQMVQQYTLRGEMIIHCDLDSSLDQLSEALEQNLYRILQECLENVIHHAQADRVTVSCRGAENMIHLMVEDNGIGFDPDLVDKKHHFGLISIRDRVSRLGGTVTITSSPSAKQKGTRIEVVIPMEKSDDTYRHL